MEKHKKIQPTTANIKAQKISIEKMAEADALMQGVVDSLDPQVISMDEAEALEVFRTFTEGKKIVQ